MLHRDAKWELLQCLTLGNAVVLESDVPAPEVKVKGVRAGKEASGRCLEQGTLAKSLLQSAPGQQLSLLKQGLISPAVSREGPWRSGTGCALPTAGPGHPGKRLAREGTDNSAPAAE